MNASIIIGLRGDVHLRIVWIPPSNASLWTRVCSCIPIGEEDRWLNEHVHPWTPFPLLAVHHTASLLWSTSLKAAGAEDAGNSASLLVVIAYRNDMEQGMTACPSIGKGKGVGSEQALPASLMFRKYQLGYELWSEALLEEGGGSHCCYLHPTCCQQVGWGSQCPGKWQLGVDSAEKGWGYFIHHTSTGATPHDCFMLPHGRDALECFIVRQILKVE